MFDANFEKVAREQIKLAFDDQDRQFDLDASNLMGKISVRGALQSSMAARAIGQLCGADIRIRGEIALGRLKRVFSMMVIDPTDDLETDLKAFLDELMNAEVAKQKEKLNNYPTIKRDAARGGASSYQIIGNTEFDGAAEHMFRKMNSEITLYAATINAPTEPAMPGAPSVIIQGDVGFFQTGTHASMNITIDAFQKEQITKALDAVQAGLVGAQDSTTFNVAEIKEMVVETNEEVQKEKPNTTKLISMLTGIAGTIQTTAALRQAYESIKSVLSFFGVHLP